MPNTQLQAAKRRFYYGWVIVAVGLVSMAFWFGFRSMFAVFMVSLVEQFGWSRAEISGVQSLAMICYILSAPIVGGLVDRYGPRRIITSGIILLAAGISLCSTVTSLFQLYLYYGLMGGVGVAFISLAAYTAIIPHWFKKRRGLASGIAASGMGLGILVFAPLSQGVISAWDWQMGFLFIGILTAVVLLPLNGFLLRHNPQDMGYAGPDGLLTPVTEENGQSDFTGEKPVGEVVWNVRSAMRTYNFWVLMAFPMLNMIGNYIILVHFVSFLVGQGIEKMMAASAFALIGVFTSGSRVIWGMISDRLGREKTYTIGMLIFCFSFYCLYRFQQNSAIWLVYAFVVLSGIGWGAGAPTFMASAADLFHGPAIGSIYGLLEGFIGIGGGFGAFIGGYLYDVTGSYMQAFGLSVVTGLAACALVWVAAPRNGDALRQKRMHFLQLGQRTN